MYASGTNGGLSVEIEGSFDNWSTRHSLQRSGKDFTLVKLLAPGVYQVLHAHCVYCNVGVSSTPDQVPLLLRLLIGVGVTPCITPAVAGCRRRLSPPALDIALQE